MLYLDRNENLFGAAPECLRILRTADAATLGTYSRDFLRGVKSTLSETLAQQLEIPERRILLSYGSEDMLKQTVHCCLSAGDRMLIPQYSWWYYQSVASECGGVTVEYPLERMQQPAPAFLYNAEEIIGAVRNTAPKLLLIASPNNPTGNALSLDGLKKILDKCASTRVVIDEAYFGFNDELFESLPQLTRQFPHLAVLRTFSKLYALAGMRIGYACVGEQYEKLTAYSARYLGYNTLSEQLALAALRSKEYYNEIGKTIANERERFYSFFDATDPCIAYRSVANFILVKIPTEHMAPLSEHLRRAEIAVKFYSEGGLASHIRITIGTPSQNSLLLQALSDFRYRFAAHAATANHQSKLYNLQ
ncbi:MAG: histidinol-phosphate aminotransferase family protein [Bacteroidota bacterium]|nr:histidinol-phosphate aminotransferase family protein [Bacteroidota bacterium]